MMQLDIAIGKHRNAISWRNVTWDWLQVSERCSTVHRTAETFAEYLKLPKSRRDEIKDIGGFVGGFLANGRRKKGNVVHRQVITLDLDYADLDAWPDWEMMQSCASLMYSTHSHSPASPRYRLVVPLDRPVTPSEYEPIIRRVAASINIERVDHSSYDLNRLMYWPSASKDGDFQFFCQEGEPLCADDVLASYVDWRDVSSWPMGSRENKDLIARAKKQGDPLEKPGLIGAFCRIYDVESAIEAFLSDVYEPCEVEGRYTFLSGTTAAGLVIHDQGRFAFSHHSTDPISGKLCNAFDLVRIHKFGHLDDSVKEDTADNRKPSYLSMVDWVRKDKQVVQLITQEKLEEAGMDFAGLGDEDGEPVNWISEMDIDGKGNILPTIRNVILILKHDPNLKGKLAMDLFERREVALGKLPWRDVEYNTRYLTDTDDAQLRNYLEATYGITSGQKIKDGLDISVADNGFHPIKEYLHSLVWDGRERIESILVEYMGAEDTPYSREVIKKALTAAVARIEEPGSKFDYVITLVGDEGLKKSSLIAALGGKWFSDSFGDIDKNKEAMESLQGVWLMEMGELASMRKATVETVKLFISKRDDRYRVAYGRRVEYFPRQCVFFATTNEIDFLKGQTGNRRFWPVLVNKDRITKDPFIDLDEYERGQIWAEAVELYRAGEKLYLSPELEAIAREIQSDHSEKDERAGLIQKYLDTLLPANWDDLGPFERRGFMDCLGNTEMYGKGTVVRERVCAAEIWIELFGGTQKDMNAHTTRFIHDIMRKIPGWEGYKSKTVFKGYGTQRGYFRTRNIGIVQNKNTAVEAKILP